MRQSVTDHLALIATAGAAAKSRIVKSVEYVQGPPEADEAVTPAAAFDEPPRPAVDFGAQEPAFNEEAAFASPLPEGAIAYEDLAVENVDDEGIPVWEDPP